MKTSPTASHGKVLPSAFPNHLEQLHSVKHMLFHRLWLHHLNLNDRKLRPRSKETPPRNNQRQQQFAKTLAEELTNNKTTKTKQT